MAINQKLVTQGNFLFRWRSFVPLLLLPPAMVAIADSPEIEDRLGEGLEDVFVLAGFIISMSGLLIRWLTVGFVPAGTSGRNTKDQRAAKLNTDGMYSIVKNPLYLGNYLTILGVLFSLKVWWLVLIGTLAYWLYIERIIAAEERYLTEKYKKSYADWSAQTPVFIPEFRLWRKPSLPFSLKTVLRREYNGLMAVCAAFFITEAIADLGFEGESLSEWAEEDWIWIAVFALSVLIFLTLRSLKKYTRILHVSGR